MLAALTMGNRASAFLVTSMVNWGNSSCSLDWYLPGSPTVSTYTWSSACVCVCVYMCKCVCVCVCVFNLKYCMFVCVFACTFSKY